jgi:hypothetical protein
MMRLVCALWALWAMAAWSADDERWAIEALYVSGQASWSAGSAAPVPLRAGARLDAGARIETGADGHAYFATVDKGFLALRPNSAVRVAEYVAAPSESVRLRIELLHGVARVVSGAAAKARPDRFRLETPTAAIGVRGTDFSVLGDAEMTRVSVRSGGVVVSPLGGECKPGGIGPCEGPLSAELFARDRDQILEVRRGSSQVLRHSNGSNGPDGAAPPQDEEDRKLQSDGRSLVTPTTAKAEVLTGTDLSVEVTPVAPPPPVPAPEPTVYWGRWAGDAARFDAITAQGSRDIVAVNSWFLVTREREAPTLPSDGVVSLALGASEALIVDKLGNLLAPAQVNSGELNLDFGAMRFDTRLDTEGGGYQTTVSAVGKIDPDGLFYSQWKLGTNATVKGAIEPDANGAAYLFRKPIDSKAEITGVTQWRR